MDTSVSISEAETVNEKQRPGDRHPRPGASGKDTNQSEKNKQKECENRLPCAGHEGGGSGYTSQEERQLLIAPPAGALWVFPKSGHRNMLLTISQSKADCRGMQ